MAASIAGAVARIKRAGDPLGVQLALPLPGLLVVQQSGPDGSQLSHAIISSPTTLIRRTDKSRVRGCAHTTGGRTGVGGKRGCG